MGCFREPRLVFCRARLSGESARPVILRFLILPRRKTHSPFGDAMAIDKSLKVKAGATANRSVLTRVERIEALRQQEKWNDERSPFGLPKVRVRKLTLKKKKKTKKDDEDA